MKYCSVSELLAQIDVGNLDGFAIEKSASLWWTRRLQRRCMPGRIACAVKINVLVKRATSNSAMRKLVASATKPINGGPARNPA
jgi:hypothetical protein